MKSKIAYLCLLLGFVVHSQTESHSTDISINSVIDGTLLLPNTNYQVPLVILIPDTGPTDRNGNQNFQNNNALKKLAEGLASNNIASFRYDKRIVKQLRKGDVDPNISFDNFIEDANSVLDYFEAQPGFSKLFIVGHGQGSLVGMLVEHNGVNGFISIAGSGKPIDEVILDQIEITDKSLLAPAEKAFSELRNGRKIRQYPPALANIFSIDTQDFMMSWMKYDPSQIVKELNVPSLFISGTKDLQLPVSETELLFNNTKMGNLKIIEQMNHVLILIQGDDLDNSKSYNESFRPIAKELVEGIAEFVRTN